MIKEQEQLHFFFGKDFCKTSVFVGYFRDFEIVSSKKYDKIFIKLNYYSLTALKKIYIRQIKDLFCFLTFIIFSGFELFCIL